MAKRAQKKARVYIGTSGWMYKSWHKVLYPPKMKEGFLPHYAKYFNSVEVNTSFYHLPKKSTFEKWKKETPPDFGCAVKMSRYITHILEIRAAKQAIRRFLESAKGLGNKLKVVLIQLPPRLRYDRKVFHKFLRDLAAIKSKLKIKARFAIEPRNKTWFDDKNIDEIRRIVKGHKFGLVFAHSSVFPKYEPAESSNVLSDFIYIRFHGPEEFAASQYGKKLLKPWSVLIDSWLKEGKTVFAYFNDDAHGYAVKDAQKLMEMVIKK